MSNANRQTLAPDPRAPRASTKGAEAVSRLAAIQDLSDDAIVAINLDGVIVGWSGGAERIYGYPAEVIVGNPVSVLVPMDRRDEWPQIIASIKRGDRVHHLETVRLRSDGAPIDVSLSVAPTRDVPNPCAIEPISARGGSVRLPLQSTPGDCVTAS